MLEENIYTFLVSNKIKQPNLESIFELSKTI